MFFWNKFLIISFSYIFLSVSSLTQWNIWNLLLFLGRRVFKRRLNTSDDIWMRFHYFDFEWILFVSVSFDWLRGLVGLFLIFSSHIPCIPSGRQSNSIHTIQECILNVELWKEFQPNKSEITWKKSMKTEQKHIIKAKGINWSKENKNL